MKEKVIPFIRQEGTRTTTIALVSCRTSLETPNQILNALTDVITQWTRETDDGIECWSQSCMDLNIGDLSMYEESFKGTHGKALMDAGIHDFKILWLGDSTESVPFDRVLAEEED